jgi:hypothetical protein
MDDFAMTRTLGGASIALILAGLAAPALAAPRTTAANLLDRVQIEDLLIDYYAPLGGGGEDMTRWYAPDGVLDINGRVYQGRKGVEQAYKDAAVAAGSAFKGKFHMLMTNPRIEVHGRTATADLIWTGIDSETIKSQPHFVEQGREHDELVKVGGEWLIKKRVITSDGGIPDFYAATYKAR